MKRVLLVSDYFWPFRVGGAEISSFIIFSELSKMGVDITVLTHRSPNTASYELANNMKIYREPLFPKWHLNFLTRMIFCLRLAMSLTERVARNKPDIVLTQQLAGIPSTLVAKLFRIPVVVMVRDYWPICYYRFLLKPNLEICDTDDNSLRDMLICARSNILARRTKFKPVKIVLALLFPIVMFFQTSFTRCIIRNGNAIITVSNYLRKVLIRNGFDPKRIWVIYNPVCIKPESQFESMNESFPSILFVGHLDFRKGLQDVIQVMPKIRAKVQNVKLTVVGNGPEKTHFQSLVKDLHSETYTRFLGQVPDEELAKLYRSCSVVVVPSVWPEPFGRVVVEALAYNKLVVASNVGGIPELLSQKNGFLVPPGDQNALSDAIVSAILGKERPEFSSSIRQIFSPHSIASRYLALFRQVTRTEK